MKDNANNAFGGHEQKVPTLHIVSDVMGTLFSVRQPRGGPEQYFADYFLSLFRLAQAGHHSLFLSSHPSPDTVESMRMMAQLIELRKLWNFLGEQERKNLKQSQLYAVGRKALWQQECGTEHIDIVIDDDDPSEWCGSYSVHIVPNTPKFYAFVDAVLDNPHQDIMALARRVIELNAAPGAEL